MAGRQDQVDAVPEGNNEPIGPYTIYLQLRYEVEMGIPSFRLLQLAFEVGRAREGKVSQRDIKSTCSQSIHVQCVVGCSWS